MRRGRAVWTVGLIGLLAATVVGQDEKAGGDAVPGTFRAFVAADDRFPGDAVRNRTDKMHCLVVENGLNPVCAVFTRTDPAKASAGPIGSLVKQLNGVVQRNRANNAAAFVLFLTLEKPYPDDEGRSEKAAAVKGLAEQLKASGVPFGLASGSKEEPDKPGPLAAWKVGDADETVVVVYRRLKEVKRWNFTADKPPTDEDLKAITDEFEKQAKGG